MGKNQAIKDGVLYARFSPRRDAENCDSVDKQLEDMRAYCKKKKIRIVGEHSDEALSGADHDRPGIWDALADLKRGHLLVVRHVNRLARDVMLALLIEDKVKKIGGTIVSIDNGDSISNDEDPTAKFTRTILHAVSELERSLGNARTRAGMRRNQRNGRRQSAIPPYGWRIDGASPLNDFGKPSGIKKDAREQKVLARILEDHAKGLGLRAIARGLNDDGIAARGALWRHETIRRILNREGGA